MSSANVPRLVKIGSREGGSTSSSWSGWVGMTGLFERSLDILGINRRDFMESNLPDILVKQVEAIGRVIEWMKYSILRTNREEERNYRRFAIGNFILRVYAKYTYSHSRKAADLFTNRKEPPKYPHCLMFVRRSNRERELKFTPSNQEDGLSALPMPKEDVAEGTIDAKVPGRTQKARHSGSQARLQVTDA